MLTRNSGFSNQMISWPENSRTGWRGGLTPTLRSSRAPPAPPLNAKVSRKPPEDLRSCLLLGAFVVSLRRQTAEVEDLPPKTPTRRGGGRGGGEGAGAASPSGQMQPLQVAASRLLELLHACGSDLKRCVCCGRLRCCVCCNFSRQMSEADVPSQEMCS